MPLHIRSSVGLKYTRNICFLFCKQLPSREDGLAPGTNRGFFYLKSVCLITKIGKAIKIKAKPSKKQSPTNNNCITAIDNATPYATLTIKNRAIKAIIGFLHSINPFVVTLTRSAITLPSQYGSPRTQSSAAFLERNNIVRYGLPGKVPGGNLMYPALPLIRKAQQSSLAIAEPSLKQSGLFIAQGFFRYFADHLTFQHDLRCQFAHFFVPPAIGTYALQLHV
jgi:hypothetical protein